MSLKHTVLLLCALPLLASAKPIQGFIVAGDELVLEQGVIEDRTEGVTEDFYSNAENAAGEEKKGSP